MYDVQCVYYSVVKALIKQQPVRILNLILDP